MQLSNFLPESYLISVPISFLPFRTIKPKPSELSGGECQRTAVARALINKPLLILADEPTGALDEENAGHLAELLNHLSGEEGVSLIVVTHSTELASQMDIVYHLKNGILQ